MSTPPLVHDTPPRDTQRHPTPPLARRVGAAADRAGAQLRRIRHALGLPTTFVLAAFVFGELIASEIGAVLDTHLERIGTVIAIGAVMLIAAVRWTRQMPTAPASYGDPGTEKLPARRGLVLLVGLDSAQRGSAAAQLFTQLPNLEYLAMVGTRETAELNHLAKVDVATNLVAHSSPRSPPISGW